MTRFKTLTRLLAGAALFFTAPALAQNAAPAEAAPAAATPAPAVDADPALWVVRDADTTIYLFGTVHILRSNLSWFDEAVKTAFDASDELKVEVTLPEDLSGLQAAFAAAGTYPAGTTLATRMTPEQRASYAAALAPLNIPVETFDTIEPWFSGLQLSLGLYASMGFQPGAGAESVLTAAAREASKPITAFETVEQQIGFFDSTPESEQIVGLIQLVTEVRELPQMIERLIGSWTSGSPEETAIVINEGMASTPETARILLTDRNRRWADTLKARMDQPGTIFVAVGAGHLAGTGSVQDFLTERGLTVERVAY